MNLPTETLSLESEVTPASLTSKGIGPSALLSSVQQYIPELWTVEKDAIYAAKGALSDGIEYARELLANHDRDLGRNHRSNKIAAEHMEKAIRGMQAALLGLRPAAQSSAPNGPHEPREGER